MWITYQKNRILLKAHRLKPVDFDPSLTAKSGDTGHKALQAPNNFVVEKNIKL
jgi:hypothetical protein